MTTAHFLEISSSLMDGFDISLISILQKNQLANKERSLSSSSSSSSPCFRQRERVTYFDRCLPRDYFHTHKGLVKRLRSIEKSGSTGIATRKLCLEAFRSKDSFCITAVRERKDAGLYHANAWCTFRPSRGNTRKMNKSTASGRKGLATAGWH